MLDSVACRSFNSTSIFASVSFAFAIWQFHKRSKVVTPGGEKKLSHRLGLERLDGFDVCTDVVRDGLEVTQDLLRLVDDRLVLQNGAVMRQVDGRRLGVELAGDALGFRVALAECLQGCDGLCGGTSVRFGQEYCSGRGACVPFPRPSDE